MIFLLGDLFHPTLNTGVAHQFAHIDVGIVQPDVAVSMGMLERAQKIVANVRVRVAPVDETHIDRRQRLRRAVEKVGARRLIVRHEMLDAEAGEVRAHFLRIVPLRRPADRWQWPMAEYGVRRIDEAQLSGLGIVLQTERETYDAETEARADH